MALRVVSPLISDKSSVTLPATLTFSVALSDPHAAPGTGTPHDLTLVLQQANDLLFDPPGTKTVTPRNKRIVRTDPTVVSFGEKITGTGLNLASFSVTLIDENGTELSSCSVALR